MENGGGNGSVVHRRILGRRLRLMREEFGLTLEEAAPRLDWSTSTLSRIENGQQAPNVHGVRSMLDLYDVGGDNWDELLAMTREVRRRGWWRSYGMGDNAYVGFESRGEPGARVLAAVLPGVAAGARVLAALFAAWGVHRTTAEIDDEVTVRRIRQRRLTSADDLLELVAVVDESALHRPIGGTDVLREQLRHVSEAAELPSVTLQVVPTAAGAYAGMASTLIVLSFDHLGEPDIVYVEHAVGAVQLEKAADVNRASMVFDRLRSAALDPEESLARIQEAAARL